jgi:hypothetical protein
MQRTWKGVGLAILAAALLTSGAFAQRRGGGGPGREMLLRMPEVQAELKLTDEQKTKINEMQSQLRAGRRGQGGGFRDLSREEREKQLAERRANEQKQLQAILNTDQLKRYRQLQLQRQGLLALRDTTVQDELKLTTDQRSKVDGVLTEQTEEMRKIRQSAAGDRAAARTQTEALRKKTEEKLEALLTDDQKKQWKEMLGAPFKFPEAPAQAARDAA